MKIKTFILLFLICCIDVSAQEYLFEAQNITPDDGLSNLMTTTISKDRQGFLWIGTQYGLNKYDGHTFQQYTVEENGLFTNPHIRRIEEDEKGNLWLFHFFSLKKDTFVSGIDIFDPKSEQALPFNQYFKGKTPFDASESIVLTINDPKKRIWLANKRGQIFLYQKTGFKKIIEREDLTFSTLTVDKEDHIWLSSQKQLLCIDTLGNVLESHNLPEFIENVFIGENKEIWVVTFSGLHFSKKITIWSKQDNATAFQELILTKKGQSYINGHQAVRSSNGFWHIMVNSHFELFDEKGAWLFEFNSLFDSDIQTDINDYLETDNNSWFATPLGIVRTSVRPNLFQLIHRKETLSDCRNIIEDENGHIYFLNGHLFQWNKNTKRVKQVSENMNNIGLVYRDSLFFAGFHDLNVIGSYIDLRKKEEKFIVNSNPEYYQLSNLLHLQNNLYLISQVKGLGYLDLNRKAYLTFDKYNGFEQLKNAKVYYCHKNTTGIWIATSIGIFFMTEEKGVLLHFDTESGDLPFNHIRYIYEDEEGIFWLATQGGGVIKWDQKKPKNNRQFTTIDGLSNNYLYAIHEDDFNRLWISSDKGLMCMDKESYEIKTYLTDDGLPHNEFNQTAHYKGKDGALYFGGLGGLITFHPKDFRGDVGRNIPLEFTKFYILEDEKESMTNNTALLQHTNEIIIQPEDKFFEVHFTLLDFESPDNHRYSYQIEGYSNHWNQIKENYIRITNLPSGEYVLRVRGQNRKKGWSNQELVLKIKILKPFYLKIWFNVLILVLVIIIGLIIIRWRGYQAKKRQKQLEQQVSERTQTIQEQAKKMEQLDKVKTRFFSNITHEFRTPLTLILGPLEQLITQTPTIEFNEKLSGVLKNAKHLLTLINQMLDLSKIESGEMRVALSRGDIVDYTEELTKRFQALAEEKEQKLTFISYKDHWETNFDKAKWDKIIYNLLSNALKFTPSGNAIQLCIARVKEDGKEFIRLDVKDTGQGIEAQHLGLIFNHFYQIDYSNTREQEGTGIGLALVKELVELQNGTISVSSELHKGTSFEVQLPVLDLEESTTSLNNLVVEPRSTLATMNVVPLNKGEKLELLLIEDNEEMRNYIISCIDLTRYNVREASNGEEGIEKAQKFIPDLIVSDVMMPKKDGFEVIEIIRNQVSTSHIPFIFLTAKTVLESRLRGFSKGADAYLTKPFSPQELCLRIEKLIESRSLLQQRYKETTTLSETDQLVLKEEDPFIAELRSYIIDNINEPDLSGDRIGKHFLISRVHLHRKLKALTNQPISDFVRAIRLKKALELINEGKLNVSEIAYETGFSSISHFSRSFKKAYGKAPSKM